MLFYCQILLNFQSAQALIQVRSLSYLEKLNPILEGYKAYFPSHWDDEK